MNPTGPLKEWNPTSTDQLTHRDRVLALAISMLDQKKPVRPSDIAKILTQTCVVFPYNRAISQDPSHAHHAAETFDFIRTLDRCKLREVLDDEDPEKIALLAFFFNCAELSRLIAVLEPPVIVATLIKMDKISQFSHHSIKQTAAALAIRIQARVSALQKTETTTHLTPPPFRHSEQVMTKTDMNRQNLPKNPMSECPDAHQKPNRDSEVIKILSE